MEIKSQDTLIAIKIWSIRRDKKSLSVRDLADVLGISAGEISKGVKRLAASGLVVNRGGLWHPGVAALNEWLAFGVRYAYPAAQAGFGRGMPSVWNCPHLKTDMLPPNPPLVWASTGGKVEGIVIKPVHPKVAFAAEHDMALYIVFSLVEAIRFGRPRELKIARHELKKILEGVY